jgi:hypothetical protein
MVGVTRGTHLLTLIPARNDHSMVMSKAVMIPFYHRGPFRPEPAGYSGTSKPSVMITSPTPGSTVGGLSFTMRVRYRARKVADPGQCPEPRDPPPGRVAA